MKVFNTDGRHLRICLDGTRNFARVKAGDMPEQHGLDIKRLAPGLLKDGVEAEEPVTATITLTEEELLGLLTTGERVSACIKVMLKEDPLQENTELWTKARKPRVDLIEDLLGEQITEAERDAAWDSNEEEVK